MLMILTALSAAIALLLGIAALCFGAAGRFEAALDTLIAALIFAVITALSLWLG